MNMDMDADFDWAHDAFVALNAANSSNPSPDLSSDKWSAFPATRPNLPTQSSIERHGQITPPEDLSPLEPAARRDSVVLQSAMSTAQLPAELPWPLEHQLQALRDFQPQQQRQSIVQAPSSRAAKAHHIAKKAPANPSRATTGAVHQTGSAPQPPKRKRGRPKSQPQPQSVETYSQDGFPFPVSNARQSHLEKNRVAAHKCRQRRKEYIDGLEARGREASSKNKALKENVALLREEILELKNEVLRHAGCNFWAVDEYLARCAGDLLGMDGPPLLPRQKDNSTINLPNKSGDEVHVKAYREMSIDSFPSQQSTSASPENFDDYFLDSLDATMEGTDS